MKVEHRVKWVKIFQTIVSLDEPLRLGGYATTVRKLLAHEPQQQNKKKQVNYKKNDSIYRRNAENGAIERVE